MFRFGNLRSTLSQLTREVFIDDEVEPLPPATGGGDVGAADSGTAAASPLTSDQQSVDPSQQATLLPALHLPTSTVAESARIFTDSTAADDSRLLRVKIFENIPTSSSSSSSSSSSAAAAAAAAAADEARLPVLPPVDQPQDGPVQTMTNTPMTSPHPAPGGPKFAHETFVRLVETATGIRHSDLPDAATTLTNLQLERIIHMVEERSTQMSVQLDQMRRANVTLKEQLMELEHSGHALDALEAELFEEREKNSRERADYRRHLQELESASAQKDAAIENLSKENELLLTSTSNLEMAMRQVEEERQLLVELTVEPLQQRVQDLERQLADRYAELSAERQIREELQASAEKLSEMQPLQENNRKLREEISILRDRLEESMTKWKSAMDSEEVVDRRLIQQVLGQYVHRRHDRSILELIMKILRYSPEERALLLRHTAPVEQQGMGAGRPSGSSAGASTRFGWIGSSLGAVWKGSSSPSKPFTSTSTSASTGSAFAAAADDSASLSDLFLQFLIKETAPVDAKASSKGAAAAAAGSEVVSSPPAGLGPPSPTPI